MNYNLKLQLKLIVPFLIVILNISLIIFATIELFMIPSTGMIASSSARVGFVDPLSPINMIVHVGDEIVSINSYSILEESALAQEELISNSYIDRVIYFEFTRMTEQGESVGTYELPITLTRPSILMIFFRLSPIIVAIAFWLMGVFFVIYRPAGYIQSYLFVFCQAWAALLSINSIIEIPSLKNFYFVIVLTTVVITVLLHLHFPTVVTRTPRLIVTVVICGIVIIEGLFEIYEITHPSFALRSMLDISRSVLLFLSLLFALFMVARSYFVSKIADQKRQIGFITIGGGIAILPLFVFSLLPDVYQGYPIFPYELVVYLFVAIPISYGYSIWKFNFVKLARYASRTSTIIFSTTIMLGIYIVLSYGILNEVPLQSGWQSIFDVLIVILPVLFFVPFYNRLQKWIDRLFYGGWYSYSLVVDQVSATLEKVDDYSNLSQPLSNTIKQLMRLKWIGLFFPDENGNLQLSAFSGGDSILSTIETIKIPRYGQLVEHLKKSTKVQAPQHVYAVIKSSNLTMEEMVLLKNDSVFLLVPILDLQDSMGLFVLGAKETGDPFDLDDIKILDVISRLTSITFQNFQLIQKLEEKVTENEQYKREILRVREEERKHISRELHDQVIQELVGLNYQIAGLRREMLTLGETAVSINGLQEGVSNLIQQTRLLCQDLRPPALDLGLIPSVRSVVHNFELKSDTVVDLIVNGERNLSIDEDIALCLYRCISEALENIFKHANANHVIVEINLTEQQISFAVSDNGRGFIKPAQLGELMKQNHFGLVGMRERIELFDGTFDIHTKPQSGTVVHAAIPHYEKNGSNNRKIVSKFERGNNDK